MSTSSVDRSAPASPSSSRRQSRRRPASFVRCLGSGRWECHLPARFGGACVGVYATAADAKRALHLALVELGSGPRPFGEPACTVADLVTAFINFGLPEIRLQTRTSYLTHLRYRISGHDLGKQSAATVEPQDVRRWQEDLEAAGVSQATQNATRALLDRAYDWGFRWGYLALNPAAVAHPVKAEEAPLR